MIDFEKKYAPVLEKIDTLVGESRKIVAIDGGSGSGKTTLASILAKKYDATVFHMDDFFLTPEMRTQGRLNEVGGNVDRERFENEVLIPLIERKNVNYRPFDCHLVAFKEEILVIPKNLVIIEGSYSMHPSLEGYYDLSVFLDIDKETQRERILKRNSDTSRAFFEKWILYENVYFEKTDIKNRCDIIIDV